MTTVHPLREWIQRNTTQSQFARDMGCSAAHISEIIAGRKGASLSFGLTISQKTGVPVESLSKPRRRRSGAN